MPVTKQVRTPCSDDPHDAAGCPNELVGVRQAMLRKPDNSDVRAEACDQVAHCESDEANRAFKRRSEDIKREQIEENMQRVEMQEKRSEQAPVFSVVPNRIRFKRANAVKDEPALPVAMGHLKNE